MNAPLLTELFTRIDGKREELIALTQDLIRIPTTNPPGEHYEDCARFIGDRLAIFVGVDDAIVEGIDAGATGWIAGLVSRK